jgi:RNA polymerase-binding transcription factor DksA
MTRRALSARETEQLRQRLLLERTSLQQELASLRGSMARLTEREERDELVSLLEELLRDVADALDRIGRGTFGRCEGCGRPIARERLEVLPRARLCIRCQRREDVRSRWSRSGRSVA